MDKGYDCHMTKESVDLCLWLNLLLIKIIGLHYGSINWLTC